MFDHFILTRFNARPPWAKCSDEHLGVDTGWLERRFDLYEKVCLKSVACQTEKSFHWLLFMDSKTPDRFVARMDKLSAKHAFIIPIYMDFENEDIILNEMRSRSNVGCNRIMTRLDNDDAIHPSMVENIQKLAQDQGEHNDLERGFFISFPMGYSEHEGDYYLQHFRYNTFVSFVSNFEHNIPIHHWGHTEIAEVAPVFCKYARPMWCQVIHGENVSNTLRGLYWPWGRYSGLVGCRDGINARSFAWKCGEFCRSFKRYILRK